MPKPTPTYLRTQQPTKVANQADQARLLRQKVEGDQRMAFAAILQKRRLDPRRLAELQKLAESLKNFGKEPGTRQGVLVKALGEAADLAQEVATLFAKDKALAADKELQATVVVSGKKLGSAADKLGGVANAANVLAAAVALIAFVMAVKKASAKFGGPR